MAKKHREKSSPRKPAQKRSEPCAPSPEAMQKIVAEFASTLGSKKRPKLIGCLVVLAWQRQPSQVHSQSVLLADEDSVREILLTTVREHWEGVDMESLASGYPTGHA